MSKIHTLAGPFGGGYGTPGEAEAHAARRDSSYVCWACGRDIPPGAHHVKHRRDAGCGYTSEGVNPWSYGVYHETCEPIRVGPPPMSLTDDALSHASGKEPPS